MKTGRNAKSSGWASGGLGLLLWAATGAWTGSNGAVGASVIVDHRHVNIAQLTEAQIVRAKATLHIAYGHTSHGGQLTDGMSGLVAFANGGGKGLALPQNIFAWNDGGTGGALDLHDYALCNDVGYYPDWVACTTNYLNDPVNADVNVVIWSWCGQMGGKYAAGTLTNEYLQPMATLEARYPRVTFVYMTGHVDIWDDTDNKAACAAIRAWCASNGRVLYDFNDIERYDPNGTYYPFVNDDCSVYNAGGTWIGNWATAWQNSHAENVDWYNCGSAHSEPLNANQKAYAVWALWCRLAERLQTPSLSVAPASRLVNSAAGTTMFAVVNSGGGTMPYAASESCSWLNISGGATGTNTGTISVAYDANLGETSRTGMVTVAATGAANNPTTVTVVQRPYFAMSPTGGAGTGRRPAFSWTAVAGATWYQIWLTRNGQPYSAPWVNGATTWSPATSGLPGGSYRWWVRPWGPASGYGEWEGPADFSVPAGTPGALTQIEPTGVQSNHVLNYRWQMDANATWYRLWAGRTGAGTWHDRWFELSGTGIATVVALGLGPHPGPAKPIQTSPQGAISTNRPTFQWSGGACTWWLQGWGPDGYGPWSGPMDFSIPHAAGTWHRVYVSRGATMAFDRWTNGTNLPAPSTLSSGAHSWWLGVWDAARNQTIWSDRVDFTVPPP
jgi:hypothetical protein